MKTTSVGSYSPLGPRLVTDMIETKIMEYHEAPIIIFQFTCNISCHIVVDLGEILVQKSVNRHHTI